MNRRCDSGMVEGVADIAEEKFEVSVSLASNHAQRLGIRTGVVAGIFDGVERE